MARLDDSSIDEQNPSSGSGDMAKKVLALELWCFMEFLQVFWVLFWTSDMCEVSMGEFLECEYFLGSSSLPLLELRYLKEFFQDFLVLF